MSACQGVLLFLLTAFLLQPNEGLPAELPRFSTGGFARISMLIGGITADRDQAGDSELSIPSIPVTSRPNSDTWRAHIHGTDSRIWFRAVQQTRLGELEALIEGDLDGDPRGHSPRLRHAYLVLGPLLVGQTWTTFTNTSALADTDSGDPVGSVLTRQRLVRWQQPLGTDTTLSVAVEDSLNRLHIAGTDTISSTGDRRPPDLVLRVDQSGNWGNLSLSMLVREIATTWPAFPETRTDHEVGSAFSFAGRIELGAPDNLRFMFNYGSALGRYSTASTYPDATVMPDGEIALSPTQSSMVAWQHFWGPRWRSTFAFSHSRTDPQRGSSSLLTRESRSIQANLIWTPGQRLSFGIEYLYGWRSLVDGQDGELHRLQFTTRINF